MHSLVSLSIFTLLCNRPLEFFSFCIIETLYSLEILSFCDWLILLCKMSLRFIHIVIFHTISFFQRPNNIYCMNTSHFSLSVQHWWLFGLLPPLGYCGKCSNEHSYMRISQDPSLNYSGYIPRRGIARSYGNSFLIKKKNTYCFP